MEPPFNYPVVGTNSQQLYHGDGGESEGEGDGEGGVFYGDHHSRKPHDSLLVCLLLVILIFNFIAWVGSRTGEYATKYSNLGACTFGTACVCIFMSITVCLRTCINEKHPVVVKVCHYLELFLIVVLVAIASFATYTVIGPEGQQAKEHFNLLNLIICGNSILTFIIVFMKIINYVSCAPTIVDDFSQPLHPQELSVIAASTT